MAGPDPSGLGAWARELRYADHATGEVFFGPREPAALPEDPAAPDVRVEAPAGARLEDVATEFYGTPRLWWIIADASGAVDPFDVPAGEPLRVPDLARVHAEALGK